MNKEIAHIPNNVDSIEARLKSLRTDQTIKEPEPTPFYFRDGIRKIYWIIVLEDEGDEKDIEEVCVYLSYLEIQGFELEYDLGYNDSSLIYVKIHASEKVIRHLANLFDLDIDNAGHNYIVNNWCKWKFRETDLTKYHDDVFKRRGKPTSCEAMFLMYRIMSDPLTHDEKEVFGLEKLIKLEYIKDAFPLHDGPWQYTNEEEMNDRQILSTYWASFSMFCKEQPINLIESYYGTEVAFFFAWCQFDQFRLFVFSTTGIVILLINLMVYHIAQPQSPKRWCNYPYRCPVCKTGGCRYEKVTYLCQVVLAELLLGNSIIYAIIVAILVAVFMILWRRRENMLSVRWNAYESGNEYKIRYDYKDMSTFLKQSKVTGKIEPYIPLGTRMHQGCFTYLVMLLVMALIFLYLMILSLLKRLFAADLEKVRDPNKSLVIAVCYGSFQVLFIKLCSMFYVKLAIYLTNMEVPKTEYEFESGVIYKSYIFAFANNYFPIIYTFLVRDNALFAPGYSAIGELDDGNCLVTGCTLPMAMQIFVVMFLKYFGDFFILLIRYCCVSAFRYKSSVPTWEEEYYLKKNDREFLTYEFTEMIIHFGYVSFFMALSPTIGPIAFFSNMLRTRLSALRLIRQMRRPIPKKNRGIGAWNKVMKFASYFSVVCNAFIIGCNMRVAWLLAQGVFPYSTKNFFDFIFSRYFLFDRPLGIKTRGSYTRGVNDSYCIYTGQLHQSNTYHRYDSTGTREHYMMLTWQFVLLITFENLLLLIVGAIYHFVDPMPRRVKEQLRREKMFAKEIKMKMLERKLQGTIVKNPSAMPE